MNNVTTQAGVQVPLLRAQGLCKSFGLGGNEITVLNNIDLEINTGDRIAILGTSGIGKTTFLHLLGLLDRPTSGEILLNGQDCLDLSASGRAIIRNQNFGFIFQFYHLLHEMNALENVMLPALITNSIFAWPFKRREVRKKAIDLLEEVGLKDRIEHRPNQLSGGERQRVTIARALINSPDILFCDEPTGNLDIATSQVVTDLLWEINQKYQTAVVLVTHDLSIIEQVDRVLVFEPNGSLRQVEKLQAAQAAYELSKRQEKNR
ncbi:ABC transporter ATP-binding protein [Planctomycetota bacterium]